jgi:chromosome segregation ATPase
MFGSWNWRLHSEAGMRLSKARALEAHEQALRAAVEAGARRIRELTGSLQVSSNRIAEVAGLLEAETDTHDPLRRQIETMLAEQIRIKDSLARREKAMGDLDSVLGATRKTNEELRAQGEGQRNRIATLEADLKGAGERESALRTQLGDARDNAAGLKTKLDGAQRSLDDAVRRLAEGERLIAELRRQKQAAEAAAATNAVPTVSSP